MVSGVSCAFFGFQTKHKPLWHDTTHPLSSLPLRKGVNAFQKVQILEGTLFLSCFIHMTFLDKISYREAANYIAYAMGLFVSNKL